MKTYYLLFYSLHSCNYSFADPDPSDLRKRTISGKVIDKENGYPLEYATVSFWSVRENKMVDGCITDQSGKFEIKLKDDTYNIIVEYISYKTYRLNNEIIDSDQDLGVIAWKSIFNHWMKLK